MSNGSHNLPPAAPFNPSGPLLLSQMPQGTDLSAAGSSASSYIVDISQDDDGEQRKPISLMSPEVRAKWRQQGQGGQQSQSGGEAVVIDLLDDDDDGGRRPEQPSRASRSSEPFDPMGGVCGEYRVGEEGDHPTNWTAQFSSTIVQDESGDVGMGGTGCSVNSEIATESAPELQQETPQKVQESVLVRREEDEQPDFMLSKQELISRANQAWTSAHLAHAPKAFKPAMKFTPTLKKTDRNDSSSSLNRSLAAAAVSPPAVCVGLAAATPDVLSAVMDIPSSVTEEVTEEKVSAIESVLGDVGGMSNAIEGSTGESQSI